MISISEREVAGENILMPEYFNILIAELMIYFDEF